MDPDTDNRPKKLRFGILLLLSYTIFVLGSVIDGTFRWTNHFEGFLSGLIQGLIFGIAWCGIYVLPWSLLVLGFFRCQKWSGSPSRHILAPSFLVFSIFVGGLLLSPPTPARRFRSHAGSELPRQTKGLRYNFTGGGIVDYADTYYFETSPEEIQRLIREMKLKRDETYEEGSNLKFQFQFKPPPNCPDFTIWKDAELYHYDDKGWYYILITDARKTQAYVFIHCI